MIFNQSQQIAVNHKDGPMLVLAGPGSGKTTVMISRIQSLIRMGIEADNILAVTFSRSAAEEMKSRFSMVSQGIKGSPFFGTFHSVFLKILLGHEMNSEVKIITEKQKIFFVRCEIERFNIPVTNADELAQDILNGISKYKSQLGSSGAEWRIKGLPEDLFIPVYTNYELRKNAADLLDFDDIIIKCLNYLEGNPDVLNEYQDKFRYICVDEFQDINPIQYKTIKLLSGNSANLFAVGDDDQSIYGFRGSSPEIMKQFIIDYPEASLVTLDINYRCSPSIVKSSLRLIGENKNRFTKAIKSGVSFSLENPVEIVSFPDRFTQLESITKEIKKMAACGSPGDTAILFRNNMDTGLLMNIFDKYSIQYSYLGKKPGVTQSFISKDISAYINLGIMLRTGKRNRSMIPYMMKIINKPSRYILPESLSVSEDDPLLSLEIFYSGNSNMQHIIHEFISQISFLSGLNAYAQIKYIRSVIGYDRYLQELSDERNYDINEYFRSIGQLEEFAKASDDVYTFIKYINDANENEMPHCVKSKISEFPVKIMTIHASKGLEFDNVYIPDVNETVLPYTKSVKDGNIEEERRLLYVGMTRARKRLRISYTETRYEKKAVPSRFLDCLMSEK